MTRKRKVSVVRSDVRRNHPDIVFLPIITLVVLLAACSGPQDYIKYQGTDGLLIGFMQNAPPSTVYEDQPFPVRFELTDAGAENVSYDRMLVTFSADPLYVTTPQSDYENPITGGVSPYNPANFDSENTEILGRSLSYRQGQKLSYSIPSDFAFRTKAIIGQRESPQTSLTASVCYAYQTHFTSEVCIDTNLYGENQRQQSCKQADITTSGGQGAPISITQVEVTAIPTIRTDITQPQSIKPVFTIHIQDVGKGYLIGPDSLPMASACVLKSIPREQLNAITINATLLKTKLLCGQASNQLTQGIVKLIDGKGEITCTVPDDALNDPVYSGTQNFQTVLAITLSYYYKTSTSTTLAIQRIPGTMPNPLTGNENGKVAGYHYSGDALMLDASGNPITECSYYGANPTEAPASYASKINPTFSCACSAERCLTLSSTGKCIVGLCPGSSNCCTDSTQPSIIQGGTTPIVGQSFRVQPTVYYIPDCAEYSGWSTTGDASLGSSVACKLTNKGFYEDVKCQGSGYCRGQYYSYTSIKPTEADSKTVEEWQTKCGTQPAEHHTIAVNAKDGSSCYVPLGSTVTLDFGDGNVLNGEYAAEDTGSLIQGCRIDYFAGIGKSKLKTIVAEIGSSQPTLTITQPATSYCKVG